jgi:hypothetical protein
VEYFHYGKKLLAKLGIKDTEAYNIAIGRRSWRIHQAWWWTGSDPIHEVAQQLSPMTVENRAKLLSSFKKNNYPENT